VSGSLKPVDVNNGLAWFLLAFAIFNTYIMFWSLRVNVAVFGVFLALWHVAFAGAAGGPAAVGSAAGAFTGRVGAAEAASGLGWRT
jgi:succinate-acetate transporter protein